MLDIANRFDSLTDVIRSITGPSRQLALTLVLRALVVYMYTIISFYAFPFMYFDPLVGDYGESKCVSMIQCFIITLDYGIRSGGGLGDALIY